MTWTYRGLMIRTVVIKSISAIFSNVGITQFVLVRRNDLLRQTLMTVYCLQHVFQVFRDFVDILGDDSLNSSRCSTQGPPVVVKVVLIFITPIIYVPLNTIDIALVAAALGRGGKITDDRRYEDTG